MTAFREWRAPDRVYFIHDCARDLIKIGSAHDPEARLRVLERAAQSRLALLGSFAGGMNTERAWHYQFREARVTGEWFSPVAELKSAIEHALAGTPPVYPEPPRADPRPFTMVSVPPEEWHGLMTLSHRYGEHASVIARRAIRELLVRELRAAEPPPARGAEGA